MAKASILLTSRFTIGPTNTITSTAGIAIVLHRRVEEEAYCGRGSGTLPEEKAGVAVC